MKTADHFEQHGDKRIFVFRDGTAIAWAPEGQLDPGMFELEKA